MFKLVKSLVLIIVILVLAGFVFYTYQITASISRDTEPVDFVIEPGEGVNQRKTWNTGLNPAATNSRRP